MLAVIHTRDTRAALTTHDTTTIHENPHPHAATLDALTTLVEQLAQAPACVYVSDGTTRREILAVAASFPNITFVTTPRGQLLTLLDHAASVLDDLQRAPAPELPSVEANRLNNMPVLTIATDASKGHRRGVGYACVTETGKAHRGYHPDIRSILVGELLGIRLALAEHKHRRLHILTDSKAAVSAIRFGNSITRHAKAAPTVTDIHRLMRDRDVTIEWVPGHSGHALNETAHRLAVAARRLHEARVDVEARSRIIANITAPLREAIAA